MRRIAFIVAALAASCVFAQSPGQKGETVWLEAGGKQTSYAGRIDTRSFFPQVSRTLGQRGFRPKNPRPFGEVGSPGPAPIAHSDMTSMGGPSAGAKFPGIGFTGWFPPDPDLAVGPAHVVQVVNSNLAFYSKAGALQFSQDAFSFFSPVRTTNFQFDPKVLYDRIAQRFVIIYLEWDGAPQVSTFLIAVSDDSNPNGAWFMYAVNTAEVFGGSNAWLDYPGFGYNKDGYVVCGNMFGFSPQTFRGSKYVVVPKAPVLVGAPVTTFRFLMVPGGSNAASPQAAEMFDAVTGRVYGALRLGFSGVPNLTRFFAIENLGGAVPTMATTDIAVTPATWMPALVAGSTNGQVLDALEGRILNARWRPNRLYLSYPFDQGGSRVGTRWAEYDTGNWPAAGTVTELQAGNYTSGTLHQFMPAVNVNKHGDVSILFTQSSAAVTASLAVAGRISTDPANTMGGATVMATSVGNNYGAFRWGDYFDVDVDPVDDEMFWGTGMVVDAANNWQTHILSWFVSRTWFLAPTTSFWFRGTPQSGNNASLAANDDNYYVAKAGLVLFPSEPPAQLQFEATAPAGTVLDIDLDLVAKVNTPGLSQRLQLWDWVNGVWVQVGTDQASTTGESFQTGSATGTLSRFVQVGTQTVRGRAQFFRTGLTLVWPWTVSVDQVRAQIRVR
jgi:hypothetical protein